MVSASLLVADDPRAQNSAAQPENVTLVSLKFPGLSPLPRAGLAFAGAAAVVYPLGWLIYRFAENPGISLGRRAVARIGPRSPSRSPA